MDRATMKQYRKKPVVIEAIQVTQEAKEEIEAIEGVRVVSFDGVLAWASIDTLEGTMTASLGDYIIRGVKGELYPCKPDIFAATYDAVADVNDVVILIEGA